MSSKHRSWWTKEWTVMRVSASNTDASRKIGKLVAVSCLLAPAWPSMEPGTFRRPVVDQSPHRPRPDRAGLEW